MNCGGGVKRGLRGVVLGVALATVFLALPGTAAQAAVQFLTFDEYPVGTTITTHYAGQGVVFFGENPGEDPEIHEDESSWTSPVLTGYLGFYSPIRAQFVVPGTSVAAPVSNLSMDVGYIDDPESTQVLVHTTAGPVSFYPDEYGFNEISLQAPNITGFEVKSVEYESAGFGIDNLGFTVPDPPPPPPPLPPPVGCIEHDGSLRHRIWANLKCKLEVPVLVARCGVSVASNFPVLRIPKTAAGLYKLSKTPKRLRPLAKVYNDLMGMKISKDAPKGFRTFGEIKHSFESFKNGFEVARGLLKLAQAISAKDFRRVVEGLAEIAGLRPCLKLLDG
jgi:hypothetical protein